MDDLELFAIALLKEQGVDKMGLSSEVVEQMKKDLVERLENTINAAVVRAMPTVYLKEFEEVMSKGEEAIQAYCYSHVPDLKQLLASELMQFRKSYLGQ